VATHFAAREPRTMALANRTLERGEKLASRFGAEAMRLADVPQRLHEFDVVVSCTASTLPIIGLGAVERALKARRHRPMFMVDLAVPRDIEQEVGELDDVFLYTLDDLQGIVQGNLDARRAAVQQAEAIIETGVQSFVQWMDRRGSIPLIQALHAQADDWRSLEIARARKLLAGGEDVGAVLEALSKGLTQKMLHGTLAELRAADGEERTRLAQTVSAPVSSDVSPKQVVTPSGSSLSIRLPTVGHDARPEVVSLSPHLVETNRSSIAHFSRCPMPTAGCSSARTSSCSSARSSAWARTRTSPPAS